MMKHRVLAIHDLSGYGNTSLMAIIPLLYHFGIEVVALPTMLLSTNTCFPAYRTLESSAFMKECLAHYQEMNLHFSAIYSGFLGDPGQVQTVLDAIDEFADEDTLVVIDPVMADDGKLYSCYNEDMILAMRRLVSRADIITPNFTEACFLSDMKPEAAGEKDFMRSLGDKLHALGAKDVIITSAPDAQQQRIIYSSGLGEQLQSFSYQHIPCYFTGTGDIFSALILAYALNGIERKQAIPLAAAFISSAIQYSVEHGRDGSAGVLLHEILPTWDFLSDALK